MDPKQLFLDERLVGVCAYCGVEVDSHDHIPSLIFLDKPYPENLPVVGSCTKCNRGFSIDEEYVACFIECVIQGTTTPNENFRKNIAKTLEMRPPLRARIEATKIVDNEGNIHWKLESERIKIIVLKLARGHMSYELGLQRIDEPVIVEILPLPVMTTTEQTNFNTPIENEGLLYPEVGSRAFIQTFKNKTTAYSGWRVVQNNRYRYTIGQSAHGDWVKFVISEYLACRVIWE